MSSSRGASSAAGPSNTSLRGDLFDYNVRLLNGADFKHTSRMNFEGEAEILCECIFHSSVTFITDKVRIYGDATYHASIDASVLAFVPFEHMTPNDFRDWNVKLVCTKQTHFSDSNGIVKIAAGEKVEFHGPVMFKGAVTLVNPIFHGDVKFAARPEIRSLLDQS
ncbi:hypothetical protein FKW77_009326 [Venturia effusa]|uniref:Uncharacterized protein n=1 Tax=Venturia effusa TaxID=50376 RepID=A0A517LCZ9_9PEZI|nr:hypothetical protein FKW77_009326 [Venturia effusa]